VVVEIDVDGPRVPAPRVPGDIVATHEGTSTRVVPDWPAPDDVDRAIAAHVVRALPPSPTLQYEPGPLLDAAVRAVNRPVGISSGIVTDAVVELARDGRLRDTAVTGYLWGSDELSGLAIDGDVVGGHADFARGASACADGLSVVLLRSQHRGRSTIVRVPEVITTARTDVDLVVTEYGVADLRGRSDAERARLLVEIAHPDHRDALARRT
jgi:hypothetical protein